MSRIRLLFILFLLSLGFRGFAVSEDSLFNAWFHQDNGGWIAGDGTYSIYLPNGRTLWLFGESFIGEVNPDNTIAPGSKRIDNCAMLQDGSTFTTLMGGSAGDPQPFIPSDYPDSTWYIPGHGAVQNDTLYIFLTKYRERSGSMGKQTEIISNDIALFTYPALSFKGIISLPYFSTGKVVYGDRVLADGEYLYIYGSKPETQDGNIPYPHVARTRTGSLTGGWEFFNGSQWTSDPAFSSKFMNNQVSREYSVFRHQDRFVLITQDIFYSPYIWSFTSPTPWGPWTNKKFLYKTPLPFESMATYDAYAHPQFAKNGELLISYNSNGDFFKIFGNVDLNKPKFIRVPWTAIDEAFITGTGDGNVKAGASGRVKVYPDPCPEIACFEYRLSQPGKVSLTITGIDGKVYRSFISEGQSAGTQKAQIDVRDLPAGIYLYFLEGPDLNATGKFIKVSRGI